MNSLISLGKLLPIIVRTAYVLLLLSSKVQLGPVVHVHMKSCIDACQVTS